MNTFQEAVYKALGWQGGTVHQVVKEIKRLRALANFVREKTLEGGKLNDRK